LLNVAGGRSDWVINAGNRIGESTGASSDFTGCPAEVEGT
jgi:hypothetical protein